MFCFEEQTNRKNIFNFFFNLAAAFGLEFVCECSYYHVFYVMTKLYTLKGGM